MNGQHPLAASGQIPMAAHDGNAGLGMLGALGGAGVQQILQWRAAQAGVDRAHPRLFRHAFVRRWLAAGGTESGLMSEAGWRPSQMVRR